MQQTSRRERKKEETRKRILNAAFELFVQNGFDNTTVDEITDMADVGKGTFYNYFPTKEAVLCDLVDNIGTERGEKIWSSVMECQDTRQRMAKALESVSTWLEKYPKLVKTYIEEQMRIPDTKSPRPRKPNSLELYLVDIFKMGQESGDIRDDLDPMQLALYFDGIFLIQVCLWYQSGAKPGLFEKIMKGIDFFLIGALSTEKQ